MTDTTADLETSIKTGVCPQHRVGLPVLAWPTPSGRPQCHGRTPTHEPCNLQAGHGGDCE